MNDLTPHTYDRQTIDYLRGKIPGLLAVYRFGSQGTAYQRVGSDLDLAFLAAQPLANLDRWELEQHLAVLLRRDVDLIDLRQANTVMRLQVVAHGERIYCADRPSVEQFEDLAFTLCPVE